MQKYYVRIGFAQLLSSLSKRELSWPIPREAMTEGSTVLRPV